MNFLKTNGQRRRSFQFYVILRSNIFDMRFFNKSLAVFIGISFLTLNAIQGQRRSDLMAEIDSLLIRLANTEDSLAQAIKNQKASNIRADAYEAQVSELKDANATLLRNLGSFSEISSRSSEALNQALSALSSRENELSKITGELTRNDSLTLALLSDSKLTLGPDAKVKVAGGSLIISESLETLFGSDTGSELKPTSESWLSGISNLIKAHPEVQIRIEGLSMIGDLALASKQALSVMNALRKIPELKNKPMAVTGRDGNFSEGIDIVLHPDYRKFYFGIKNDIKQ